MKRKREFVMIISLLAAVSVLISYSNGLALPKPKGKEVQLTSSELTRKLGRLDGAVQDGKIITSNLEVRYIESDDVDYFEGRSSTSATRNLDNLDLWYKQTYEETDNAGKVTSTVNGFESKRYTYFDIKRTNNMLFDDDDDNYNIYNGKYRIAKQTIFNRDYNTLKDALNYFDIGYSEAYFDLAFTYISASLMADLNSYNYSKLTFYENATYFSISLNANLKALKKERIEIYETFAEYFAFDEVDEIIDFKYEFVLVFERNKIIAAGLILKLEVTEEYDGETYYYLSDLKYNVNYVEKTPSAFKGDGFTLIEDFAELIK